MRHVYTPSNQDFRYRLADLLRDLQQRKPEAIDAASEVIAFFQANGLKAADAARNTDAGEK